MAGQITKRPIGDVEYAEAALNILGYQEDGEWVALALEMDLRGYGETWEEAVSDLRDLVAMQVSFALYKNEPEMIWHEAEQRFWDMFREVKRARLFEALVNEQREIRHAGGMAIPEPHVIAAQQDQFTRANG